MGSDSSLPTIFCFIKLVIMPYEFTNDFKGLKSISFIADNFVLTILSATTIFIGVKIILIEIAVIIKIAVALIAVIFIAVTLIKSNG